MLEIRHLSVDLGGRRVLDDLSAMMPTGSLTVIVGPNGAGKSTMIRAMSGELRPSRGSVVMAGRDIARISVHALSAQRAVMPQASSIAFPFLVEEIVMLGSSVPGFNLAGDEGQLAAAMETSGVAHLRGRLYSQLSGGERQRVHFARALCQLFASRSAPEATCLLLDEPTSNLDLPHQMALMSRARLEARRGRTVIAVLHDLNLAATWADLILALSGGRIAAAGPPEDVLTTAILSAVYGAPITATVLAGCKLPVVVPQSIRRQEASEPDSSAS